MTSHDFENYIYDLTQKALEAKIKDPPEQIYAVSFFVYDWEDNPIIPTLKVGYNTEQQVKKMLRETSTPEETRWNFAFWLHNEMIAFGPYDAQKDKESFQFYREWLLGLGINFTADQLDQLQDRAEENDDEEMMDALEDAMSLVSTQFTEVCCRVSKKLHDQGVIKRVFGRSIPILVHELEYFDKIALQTKKANPPGVADDFCRWITR